MKSFLLNIYESEIFKILLITYSICITLLSFYIWYLYEPQARIVIHDYGQVFESETDWKIWRLEHNKK